MVLIISNNINFPYLSLLLYQFSLNTSCFNLEKQRLGSSDLDRDPGWASGEMEKAGAPIHTLLLGSRVSHPLSRPLLAAFSDLTNGLSWGLFGIGIWIQIFSSSHF